jgi:signal peptidase II
MQTTRGTSVAAQPDAEQVRQAQRRRHVGVLIGVATLVIALDAISKVIVVATLSERAPIRLLGGLIKLEETRNSGAAFSMGGGATVVFAAVAVAVIVVILRTARKLYSGPWAIVLGLLLGGATGNLVDRIVRSPGVFRGGVVDWINLSHFAVFNLADSAITVGGVLAVLLALMGRHIDGKVVSYKDKSDDAGSAEASSDGGGPARRVDDAG